MYASRLVSLANTPKVVPLSFSSFFHLYYSFPHQIHSRSFGNHRKPREEECTENDRSELLPCMLPHSQNKSAPMLYKQSIFPQALFYRFSTALYFVSFIPGGNDFNNHTVKDNQCPTLDMSSCDCQEQTEGDG